MRLFVTKPSPYARKAWSAVLALGLEQRVEIVELPARMPTMPKPDLEAVNPLGQVPTLTLGGGGFVADSPVIVAYLDAFAGGGILIPAEEERWRVLTLQALADGCMDCGVVLRVEQLKPEGRRDRDQIAAYSAKIARTLDRIEAEPGWLRPQLDAGTLALVCAIEWLTFRALGDDPWAGRPRLAGWHSALREHPALLPTRP